MQLHLMFARPDKKESNVPNQKGTGNALARVQGVHEPADIWDITFCTHWFWGSELAFIEQTAPTDPNS